MARSKSWTESQQPENQYSYSQYVVYLFVVGVVTVGLVAWLIYIINGKQDPNTYVVTVRSDVGEGEIRFVPFQTNDMNQLENSIRDAKPEQLFHCPDFDDKESLTSVQREIENLSEKIVDQDTMIVICSAIGGVADDDESKPILRATNGDEILVEDFLATCIASSPAGNRIVILDCGHDFSIPSSYSSDGKAGDDFNKFVSAVGSLLDRKNFDQPDHPIWVVTSTSPGEVPLYSTNRRRTLLSLAVENALKFDRSTNQTASYSNVGQFYDSLTSYCHEHGGEAAQTPMLFESGRGQIDSSTAESLLVSKFQQKKSSLAEDETEKPDDTKIAQHDDTTNGLEKIRKSWDDGDKIIAEYHENGLLSPLCFASRVWDDHIIRIVEQSIQMRDDAKIASTSINDLSRPVYTNAAKEISAKFPGLVITDPPVEITDSAAKQKTEIALAYKVFQDTKYRAKYYAAIFDSLSWLVETESLERFRAAVTDLNNSIARHAGSLFKDENADLNEFDATSYRKAMDELTQLDSLANKCLIALCEININSLHGMTREMAIISLLDSPLIKMGSEDAPEKYERRGLLKMLCEDNSGGERIDYKTRIANSGLRHKLYQELLKTYEFLPTDLALRKLDAAAYYLDVGQSYLPNLIVTPRPITFTADAKNRLQLQSRPNIINLFSDNIQPLDIGLKTKPTNVRVDLECSLEPPDAPFEIHDKSTDQDVVSSAGNGKFEIKNSGGMISIFAKQDRESVELPPGGYSLTVRIMQPNQGDPFANPPEFEIPLELPRSNRVELLTKLDNQTVTDLRPWPNKDVPVEFSLSNKWHEDRTLRATLYACVKPVNHEIMPGAIDKSVQDETLRRLNELIIARSIEIPIGAYDENPQSNSVKKVVWSEDSLGTKTPFTQGLLCRVEDSNNNQAPWDFWLPVFPDTRDYITFIPRQGTNSLELDYSILPDFDLKEGPIRIRWHLSDKRIKKNKDISTNGRVSVIDDLDTALQGATKPILYVDVDDWPRRYAFVYDFPTFTEPTTVLREDFPNVMFSEVRLTKQKNPDIVDFERFDQSFDDSTAIIYGHQPKISAVVERTLFGNLEINCLINAERFNFPDSTDFLEVKFGQNLKTYYFPWKVECTFAPDESKLWKLNCNVSDYDEEIRVGGNNLEIDPIKFVYRGQVSPMDGKDKTQIVFDNNEPLGTRLSIQTPEVEVGTNYVFFEIDDIQDQSGGVGCDEDLRSSVACLVKKQFENSQIPKEGLQPPELDKKPGKDWLAAKVEGEPGTYYLGVQIRDRLGNVRNLPIERFQLIPPKPVPPPPSPEPKTHTLIVKVYVESKRLSVYSPEKLQLVIDPKDTEPGPPKDKYIYEFKDLKRGQKYTVTGKYEETSGIRFKAEGKISHTFQKGDNEEYKIKLTLKRQ